MIDKSQIIDIEEGQSGQEVAANLKANFGLLVDEMNFYEGVNTVTTLVSLPITKRSVVANVTSATNLSLSNAIGMGKELYVRIFNNGGGVITQPIPNSGQFVSMNGASVKIPSKKFVEISIWCYETNKYSIRIGEIA